MSRLFYILIFLLLVSGAAIGVNAQTLQPLRVSENRRFFQTAGGKPFFWLGDTGWLLFVRLSREEAIQYLETRKEQGFNVIQVMVLHDVKNTRNVYGDEAVESGDVSKPVTTTGADPSDAQAYDFWDHVDFVIREAAKRGLYMALVPVWGSNVKDGNVTPAQAAVFARFLATRYKGQPNIIWLNGGDIKGSDGAAVWNMIGSTIKKYDPGHLITFHPRGRYSSSEWFHQASWLDFNMFQSGHRSYAQDTSVDEKNHFGEDNWKYINADARLRPVKPTLDGEPSYENIPYGLHDSLQPRWNAADIRRYAYWSVFAGGAGFTYGDNAVMQFHTRGKKAGSFGVRENWQDELSAPGATQMQFLKKLMLAHDYFSRVPAQDLLAGNNGQRYHHLLATKGKGYAMVYTYTGEPFKVALSKLGFKPAKGSWFFPANGSTVPVTLAKTSGVIQFDPPAAKSAAEGTDRVLVLEE
ncbi:glycoside hydrolase [Niabella ginsenosidivorans]|uniref:Glycoside hydrolase n=1 Tax=Niabella ginsenosidivorans TaxID=1176587 RepID=A0A1A9HYI6_9BACT|nr:glycoside hydrolase family 140 protein [Niabella ginsenosidivorans]ANH80313.1 glycoside hydrolase [Niabella ginsenosidivorans]